MKNIIMILSILIISSSLSYSQIGFSFSLANGAVTNDGVADYYEFDVMVSAGSDSQFEVAQVYLNYNTAAFGNSIVAGGKVTVTKGSPLLDVVFNTDIGSYTASASDNTAEILAIQNTWQKTDIGGGKTGFELTNTLGTTPLVWIHVKIEIANTSVSSGISFNTTINQWDQQDYYFTSGDTDIKYTPVTASGSLNQPLPVELTSFTAATVDNKVTLNWQTATEVNNYGFEIQRASTPLSPRTLSEAEVWETIGFVEGHGNSHSPKEYSFFDDNSLSGVIQYRLKQIDTDGAFEYSEVIEIEVKVIPTEYELTPNYPNPFNPSTNISFSLPESGEVKLIVYDILGKQVAELVNKELEAGVYEQTFDASQYSSGVYIYMLSVNGKRFVKKMTLLR